MNIDSIGYNIANVVIVSSLTPGTKTKVGNAKDFYNLLKFVKSAGIIKVQATIGTQYMNGTMIANPYQNEDGIEAFSLSAAGSDSPYIVHAAITLEDGDMYVTVALVTLS